MNNKTISATNLLLPPLEEPIPYLEKVWESHPLTNGGDIHHASEEVLCEYLGVKHIVLSADAALALITVLQALRMTGEVIITPYSFVVTGHVLLRSGLKPIFVDIGQDSMNLDPLRVETTIIPQTIAVLPVHCYGNPYGAEAIQWIADIHHLKVIYDAAHAFAVRDAGGSVLRRSDLSILSFHATKVFNTFEGDAVVCLDENTRQCPSHLKNFSSIDEIIVVIPGIGGKLNEIGIASGPLQFKHVDQAPEQRREIAEHCRRPLAGVPGIQCLRPGTQTFASNAYFPILVKDDSSLSCDELYQRLRDRDMLVWRYFYPLISDFPMYHLLPSATPASPPVARSISSQALCLLIHPGLAATDVESVAGLIASATVPRRRTPG